MISSKILRKKRTRLLLILASFVGVMILATYLDGAYEYYRPRENELNIVSQFALPLREISGLASKTDPTTGELEMYAVGDNAGTLAIFPWDEKANTPGAHRFVDFAKALTYRYSPCESEKISYCKKHNKFLTSQWEALALDGLGRVFLMHEQLGTVFVFDPSQQKILASLWLDGFELSQARNRKKVSEDHDNALGEGMILLKNGHILVGKERFPPSIVEFGPEGSEAKGFENGGGPLGSLASFDWGKQERAKYVPLKVWNLPKEGKKFRNCDISEISTDKDGSLYLLSQQCQWLGRVEPLRVDAPEVQFVKIWDLPRSLHNAEAFVVLEKDKRFLVAEDKKSLKLANFTVLEHSEK